MMFGDPQGDVASYLRARMARRRIARRLRAADILLLRDLWRIAADPSQPSRRRAAARLGGNAFASWMLAGGNVPRQRVALYGRYCGPGYSGPGEPVDAIDAACRRHDAAYQRMQTVAR